MSDFLDGKRCDCDDCVRAYAADRPSTIAEALESYAAQERLSSPPRLAQGTGPVTLPQEAQSPQIDAGELVECDSPLPTAAQLQEALDYLARLVGYLDKYGGYMSSANQQALRGARRLLAECGR